MPAQKASKRIVKRQPSPVRSTKRRAAKRRAPAVANAAPDALLIAAFADALGQPKANRAKRSGRRSLSEALVQASTPGDVIGAMPGVRVTERATPPSNSRQFSIGSSDKRKFDSLVQNAAAWCITVFVTAGIVSAAAYGVTSHAPKKTIQAIASASASQF